MKNAKLTQEQIKKNKLKQLLKKFPDKVPIWLYTSFGQGFDVGNIYVIEPSSSLLQFTNSIKIKLQYVGAISLSTKNPIGNAKKGQMLTTFGQNMGELYDRYRGNEGWLDLVVGLQSTF